MITSYLVERLKRFQVENLTVRDFTTFKKHIVLFFCTFFSATTTRRGGGLNHRPLNGISVLTKTKAEIRSKK